jgi:hypothetical protein
MFKKGIYPHKGYWSSPFSRWQMSFQNQHPMVLAADTTKKFMEMRGYDPEMLRWLRIWASPSAMPAWFYAYALVQRRSWADKHLGGPTVSQACATSATALLQRPLPRGKWRPTRNVLVNHADRCSNGPHTIWPNPKGPGGEVISENWLMDNFNHDPYGAKKP